MYRKLPFLMIFLLAFLIETSAAWADNLCSKNGGYYRNTQNYCDLVLCTDQDGIITWDNVNVIIDHSLYIPTGRKLVLKGNTTLTVGTEGLTEGSSWEDIAIQLNGSLFIETDEGDSISINIASGKINIGGRTNLEDYELEDYELMVSAKPTSSVTFSSVGINGNWKGIFGQRNSRIKLTGNNLDYLSDPNIFFEDIAPGNYAISQRGAEDDYPGYLNVQNVKFLGDGRGIHIYGSSTTTPEYYSDPIIINHNEFIGLEHGIRIEQTNVDKPIQIFHNTFEDIRYSPIWLNYVETDYDILIGKLAVLVGFPTIARWYGNTIIDNGANQSGDYGIVVDYVSGDGALLIDANNIDDTNIGIRVRTSDLGSINIKNNIITATQSDTNDRGIHTENTDNIILTNNTVDGYWNNLRFWNSDSIQLLGNTINSPYGTGYKLVNFLNNSSCSVMENNEFDIVQHQMFFMPWVYSYQVYFENINNIPSDMNCSANIFNSLMPYSYSNTYPSSLISICND